MKYIFLFEPQYNPQRETDCPLGQTVMTVANVGMVLTEHPARLWTVYFYNLFCFSQCSLGTIVCI